MLDTRQIRGLEGTVKDVQTVTEAGKPVQELIDGVQLRRATTHADHRGTLCEVYDERWGFTTEPVPYAYLVTLFPDSVRGWVVHMEQDDRLFFASGTVKVALYDAREDSSTEGRVSVLHLGGHERTLLRIPAGVFHAMRNVGPTEALFVNLPTQPYRHADPDKYRLPLDTDRIPYRV